MATGGATGFVLHIDDELINKIQRADSMITDLANKSEQARTRVVEAFREMGDKGVGHFIRKLHEAQQKLDAIGSKTISREQKHSYEKHVKCQFQTRYLSHLQTRQKYEIKGVENSRSESPQESFDRECTILRKYACHHHDTDGCKNNA